MPGDDDSSVEAEYKRGLAAFGRGEYFAAHEAFETAWRAAQPADRDFFQGLVHAVVFAYQTGRGKAIGAERQREKGLRRLGPYAPAYRGLDVAPPARRARPSRDRPSRRAGRVRSAATSRD